MKHFTFYFTIFTFTTLFLSCSNSNHDEPALRENTDKTNSDWFIPVEEAIDNSNKMFNALYDKGTRCQNQSNYDVEFFYPGEKNTKSGEESGFYIVNFKNDGFAILANDRRLKPVYAISDEGHISINDTVNNKGFQWYVDNVMKPDVTALESRVPGIEKDTLPADDYVIITYDPVEISKPLIKGTMRGFHQSYPFNIYCPKVHNDKGALVSTLVGCAPLAAGTIMGYFEWPKSYNSDYYDWSLMKMDVNVTASAWAKLFARIGEPQNMNTDYGVKSSGTSPSRIIPAFNNFGYTKVLSSKLSHLKATEELAQSRPLFVTGFAKQQIGNNIATIGHAWVIDGAYYIKSMVYLNNYYSNIYYYHCLWGWENSHNNGYFTIDDYTYPKPSDPDPGVPVSIQDALGSLQMYYGFTH